MRTRRSRWFIVLVWLLPAVAVLAGVASLELLSTPTVLSSPVPVAPARVTVGSGPTPLSIQQMDAVHRLCSSCHAFPPASSFPRDRWPGEVDKWFKYAEGAGMAPDRIVAREAVARYFQERAPEQLVLPPIVSDATGHSVAFKKRFFGVPNIQPFPGVSNVKWARLSSQTALDCVVCDMRYHGVYLWQAERPEEGLRRIAEVAHPAHAEVVDLDADGRRDLIVADLGIFYPSDEKLGRVVWLRRNAHGDGFQTVVLAEHLGRVADVQAADFDGDGDLDLVAAVFGWRAVGQVMYLENQTVDYDRPVFRAVEVDGRSGAIHVPVADLNHDGRPDFVALISQQHETVVAFLNDGPGRFRPETIFEAGDPAYGSTGIQLVDLDGDSDLDVLYSNGDLMDSGLLKPYHGVQWLENQGVFPFQHHHLTALPGVHRAVAGDLDGDGDLDVLASAFIPDTGAAPRDVAILWLEQTEPRRFIPHVLERTDCDHATLDVADYDGDGDLDFVTGYMTWEPINPAPRLAPKPGWICVWENESADGNRAGAAGPPVGSKEPAEQHGSFAQPINR